MFADKTSNRWEWMSGTSQLHFLILLETSRKLLEESCFNLSFHYPNQTAVLGQVLYHRVYNPVVIRIGLIKPVFMHRTACSFISCIWLGPGTTVRHEQMPIYFSLEPESNQEGKQNSIVCHLVAAQILPGIQETENKYNQSNNTLGIPPLQGLGGSWSSRYNCGVGWKNCGCSYLGNDVQQTWVTVPLWKGFWGRFRWGELCKQVAKKRWQKLAIYHSL